MYLQFQELIKNNRKLWKVHVTMHIRPGAIYTIIASQSCHQRVECQTALRSRFAETSQTALAHMGNGASFDTIFHQHTSI